MSKIQISAAPDLAYLRLLNCCCSNISVDDFPHLEEVDVCIFDPYRDHPQEVIRLLRHLHSVKYLRLNLEILEVYSYWPLMFILFISQRGKNASDVAADFDRLGWDDVAESCSMAPKVKRNDRLVEIMVPLSFSKRTLKDRSYAVSSKDRANSLKVTALSGYALL
ncbi:hypothetical protein Tco_1267035 [Tanacetum coccineum]